MSRRTIVLIVGLALVIFSIGYSLLPLEAEAQA